MALDRADAEPREAALARIGLPIAKYLVTKRAPALVAEAMECFGGVGYVEETPLARLFRQSPLNAIWEGSGNVIALDLLRALHREPDAREALLAEIGAGPGAEEAARLLAAPIAEGAARHVIERLGVTLAAAVLARFAPVAVGDAYATRRVRGASLTFGAGEGAIDEAALVARLALEI
jgi:putative acyl-CoA dehydrogenase